MRDRFGRKQQHGKRGECQSAQCHRRAFASAEEFLLSIDTSKDAIDAVAAYYPNLSPTAKREFEVSALSSTIKGIKESEESKRRHLAKLFNTIGQANLETDEAKALLADAVASSIPRGNNRALSVTDGFIGESDPYWWLTNKGIDTKAEPNASLLKLADVATVRPNPDGSQAVSVEQGAKATAALAEALDRSRYSSAAPLVRDWAMQRLLQGCQELARRRDELRAADKKFTATIVSVVESYLRRPSPCSEPDNSTEVRASAIEAAMWLCALNQEIADRLAPLVEPLHTDPAAKVRAAIAGDLGRLWEFARDVLWRLADYYADAEQDFPVLQHFAFFLRNAIHAAPERVQPLIDRLIPRARLETDSNGDRIIEGIGNFVACLWLRYDLPRSRELLDEWIADLGEHQPELLAVAGTLRGTVVHGYGSNDPAEDKIRHNAHRLARELVDASAKIVERYVVLPPAQRTKRDDDKVGIAIRLLDSVGSQMYFSSGAFNASENQEPGELKLINKRRLFLDETHDILWRIGDAASPHTIYYQIDLLAFLRPADPTRVFDLVAHSLLDAGRMHGYEFESLGSDRFVQVVGLFLADYREIFSDQTQRAKLIACLDAFVEAGWPKARRLLYRLPELL